MLNFKKDLNDAQYRAVIEFKGPSLVIAGAGSGKTRVLTYRIAYMMANNIEPSKIMGLTFTNKASVEMRERIAMLVPRNSRQVVLGTFHAVFGKILRNEAEHIGYTSNYTIYDTENSKVLIRQIVKDLDLDSKIYKDIKVLKRISAAKNHMITASAYEAHYEIIQNDRYHNISELSKIYLLYEERCKKANAMDFDDMLLNTYFLFKNHSEVLEHYQNRYDYFLVDEFQDTNLVQYEIIKMLATKSKNLCCVGDDAQSIYSFRGAQIANIKKFRDDFNAKIYKLEQNYRSTKTIVNAANSIIGKNKGQIPKNLFSENQIGKPILIKELYSEKDEAEFVAEDIKTKILTKHYHFKDFAVLYRTNAQSRIFEELLRQQNIPYRIYGGFSFYQRAEIKNVLAYLFVISNPSDDISLLRIINFPRRGIGDTTIKKIRQYAKRKAISLWEALKDIESEKLSLSSSVILKIKEFTYTLNTFIEDKDIKNVFDLTENVLKTFGILSFYAADDDFVEKKENVEELLNSIYDFVSENDGDTEQDISLAAFLQTISLITDMDNQKQEDINAVTLMTVHSAKGLEFPIVYIVGMEDNLFPSIMTLDSPIKLQEERRLFYVAITRAMDELSILYCQRRYKYNKHEFPNISRFLLEIDSRFYEYYGTNYSMLKNKMATTHTKKYDEIISANLKKVTNTVSNEDMLSQEAIKTGMYVNHNTFGKGKVLSVAGEVPNKKAIIFFNDVGEKTLLLKFAKLSIVNSN